ncbi:MAG: YchJ family metal-binding protein [Opitutales bacterium]|jgi:SEC-C motif domain protein|nr:YchJ family metal-binding protein [Opitutales bacterium]MDP4643278.1 YchJ family metal-binding protein [Opitutales bacterium]MDP4693507.1 YchJ family metal-binding protein [Opitutales bacterium]MDP4777672.1 YchJ family metal-binding protein [Opitutales bacterium]MDP4884157.1 YchJ family metal-binding protein [Opitutales bacterium]
MSLPATQSACPCGSETDYDLCCGRYHGGTEKAPTAEALMRSRYAAYVMGAIDYLLQTTHPDKRAKDLKVAYQTTYETIQWVGLEIVSTFQGTPSDKTGKVEFKATYLQGGQTSVHHEHSRFKRHAGAWHYLDGVITDSSIG